MKLRELLTEKRMPPEKIGEILKRDCSIYIKETKPTPDDDIMCGYVGVLYRGVRKVNDGIIKLRAHKEDRKPKDTPQALHDRLNELFIEKFGWPVRNGVFVTPSYDTASGYGMVNVFFPIGKYKYVWSKKASDLTDYMGDVMIKDSDLISLFDNDNKSKWIDVMSEWLLGWLEEKYGMGFTVVDKNGNVIKNIQRFLIDLEEEKEHNIANVYYDNKKNRFYFTMYDRGGREYGKFWILNTQKSLSYEDWRNRKYTPEAIDKKLQTIVNSFRSDNLYGQSRRYGEISFWCDEYYLVTTSAMSDVLL